MHCLQTCDEGAILDEDDTVGDVLDDKDKVGFFSRILKVKQIHRVLPDIYYSQAQCTDLNKLAVISKF